MELPTLSSVHAFPLPVERLSCTPLLAARVDPQCPTLTCIVGWNQLTKAHLNFLIYMTIDQLVLLPQNSATDEQADDRKQGARVEQKGQHPGSSNLGAGIDGEHSRTAMPAAVSSFVLDTLNEWPMVLVGLVALAGSVAALLYRKRSCGRVRGWMQRSSETDEAFPTGTFDVDDEDLVTTNGVFILKDDDLLNDALLDDPLHPGWRDVFDKLYTTNEGDLTRTTRARSSSLAVCSPS
jgi:hypothetical protein